MPPQAHGREKAKRRDKSMKKISEEIREYDEWLDRKYAEREDKDNILPVGITDAEFREWAIRILLGDDWCVVTPMGKNQINEVAMEDIIFQKCGVEAKDRKGKKKEILNDDERKRLKQVVKVLIDRKVKVRWIKKVKNLYKPTEHKEHILIIFAEPAGNWFVDWTDFEEGTMYKGMEEDKQYTLDELGL